MMISFDSGPSPILFVKSPAAIKPLFAFSDKSITSATPAKSLISKSSNVGLLGKCHPGALAYVNPLPAQRRPNSWNSSPS